MPHKYSTTNSTEDDPLAQLKRSYSKELKTLKDLFPGWSDVDLVSALEESQGDLDLAITRISTGFAEQWDEVKTTKRKEKTTSKPSTPAAATTTASEPAPSVNSPANGRGGFSGRGGRGGAFAGRGGFLNRGGFAGRGGTPRGRGRGRGGARGGATEGFRPQREQSEFDASYSQPVVEPAIDSNNSWGQPRKEQGKSEKPSSNQISKTAAPTKATWAQLVKGPEPAPAPVQPPVEQKRAPSPKMKAPTPAPTGVTQQSPVATSSTPARPISPPKNVQPVVATPPFSPVSEGVAHATSPLKSPAAVAKPVESVTSVPPGLKPQKPVNQRKLKQDAPVVMPQNATMSSIGVRFGTLGLGDAAEESHDASLSSAPINSASPADQNKAEVPNAAAGHNPRVQHVPQMGGIPPFQQLAAGFMPSTVPADYSALYSDQQRAAMGYYADPSAYGQLAGVSQSGKYPGQTEAASLQTSAATQGASQSTQQPHTSNLTATPQQGQQPGAAQQYPLPYYYPYYVPNQYQSAYQSSVYPQQFSVNKSMYPYGAPAQAATAPGASTAVGGKVGATTAAPGYYGAAAGQPHMYHQYDDISSGLGNANEYGKTMNPSSGANSYGIPASQGFGSFGLTPSAQAQNPTQSAKTGGVSPQQGADYKNQRQSYDGQKFAGNTMSVPSQQTSHLSGQSNISQPATSYYNQHQMGGMHQAHLTGTGAYPAHMMHQGYQNSGLYNSRPQQQQQYWNGQN